MQTHRELRQLLWVPSLPWPSAAAGALPAGTNIAGPKTLVLVLQDFLCIRAQQLLRNMQDLTGPSARGFPELQKMEETHTPCPWGHQTSSSPSQQGAELCSVPFPAHKIYDSSTLSSSTRSYINCTFLLCLFSPAPGLFSCFSLRQVHLQVPISPLLSFRIKTPLDS